MPTDLENTSSQTAPLRAELQDLQGLADGFGRAMTLAFRRSVVDGKRLQDVLKSLALGLSSRALNQALAPIGQGIGSADECAERIDRRAFYEGRADRAARDAVRGGRRHGQSELLTDAGRLGLVGEAGPEAILPLTRGTDGSLGVRAQGGGAVNVTFNVSTPDAASFRRSETQLSAMLARAVARGQRGIESE